MTTKAITSTKAQNNFGRVLDDIIQHNTRYIIKRRNSPQAVIISLSDFEQLLANQDERQRMLATVREITPTYNLGESILDEENDD